MDIFFSLKAKMNALTGKMWETVLEFPCTVSALGKKGSLQTILALLKRKILGMGSNAEISEGFSGGDPTHTSSPLTLVLIFPGNFVHVSKMLT